MPSWSPEQQPVPPAASRCPLLCTCSPTPLLPFPLPFPSRAEAQAYARWAGARLLTEPEYELLLARADQCSPATANSSAGGTAVEGAPSGAAGEAGPAGSAAAVYQLESAGWEWTATPLEPLPGGDSVMLGHACAGSMQ